MADWQGRKVVVTGCSGLIGTPLCRLLLERGADVVGYDLMPPSVPINFVPGDILDGAGLRHAVSGASAVIHLAAVSGVEAARANPMLTWAVNIQGTWNVLQACLEAKVEAVVHASSNHVYGPRDGGMTTEDAPLRQLDAYSVSKTCGDYLARAYAHNYGLPTVVVRNTNCFSEDDPHLDHIVPGTIRAILRGKRPVIRSNGNTYKSYLYVDDVADAYIKAAEYLLNGGEKGRAFNVASDIPASARELVTVILSLMGSDLEPYVLGQGTDQADELLDSSAARKDLGWTQQFTLSEALRRTIEGFRERAGEKVLA